MIGSQQDLTIPYFHGLEDAFSPLKSRRTYRYMRYFSRKKKAIKANERHNAAK
jgi:hypothetical protein